MIQDKSNYSRAAFWIMSVALVLFVLILCGVPRAESDLFWQLRTGREIIAQHSVPYADAYSWTAKGHPWVVHEWLAFVLFWTVYSLGHAFTGLFVLKTIVAAATVFILFKHVCWATQYTIIPALFLTGLAAMSASTGFEVRPQLFTYFFLTIVCSCLLRMREEGYANKRIWGLVPVFLVWANVHSGVISGLFLMGAWCVGDIIDGLNRTSEEEREGFKKRVKNLLPVAAACLICTLVTPYGLSEYRDFVATLGNSSMINSVSEWASPSLHDSAGKNFCFLAGILIFGLLFAKQFVLLGDVIIFVALLHSSLASYRNIPLFALVGTMIAVPYLAQALRSRLPGLEITKVEGKSLFGTQPEIPAVCIAAAGMVFIAFVSTLQFYKQDVITSQQGSSQAVQIATQSVSTLTEPVSGTRFIQSSSFPPSWRMYNGYDEGGYLIWKMPEYPVSIDSRADVYFDGILDDYLTVNRLSYNWKTVLAKYPSDFIMSSSTSGVSRLVMTSHDWALVYASDPDLDSSSKELREENTVIFVRRSLKDNAEISRIRNLCPAISTSDFMIKYADYPAVH